MLYIYKQVAIAVSLKYLTHHAHQKDSACSTNSS